jgi:HSP20 family protein
MQYRRFSYRYTSIFTGIASPLPSHFWGSHVPVSFAQPQWQPPADLYETATNLIVKAEIAGMAEENFNISLYKDALVIEGVRSWDIPEGQEQYHAVNIHYGSFRLEIPLKQEIQPDQIQARYDRGFLYVILAKKEVKS